MSPTAHIRLLSDYLKLANPLSIPPDHSLACPVLRHPDFSPNNILVSSKGDIVGIIDWQHAAILPLCLCAGIPNHFQNWCDLASDTLTKPEARLPENFNTLSQHEQETVQETMRKRLVHFYYAALNLTQMPENFDPLRNESSVLRAKLFNRAGAPWEGDSLSLKYTLIQAQRNWPMHIDNSEPPGSVLCPVDYSEEEIQQCTNDHEQEQVKIQELDEVKDVIGIDSVGWVPDDDQLEKSRAIVQTIKEGLLEHSHTEIEQIAIRDLFPFDDHGEI